MGRGTETRSVLLQPPGDGFPPLLGVPDPKPQRPPVCHPQKQFASGASICRIDAAEYAYGSYRAGATPSARVGPRKDAPWPKKRRVGERERARRELRLRRLRVGHPRSAVTSAVRAGPFIRVCPERSSRRQRMCDRSPRISDMSRIRGGLSPIRGPFGDGESLWSRVPTFRRGAVEPSAERPGDVGGRVVADGVGRLGHGQPLFA